MGAISDILRVQERTSTIRKIINARKTTLCGITIQLVIRIARRSREIFAILSFQIQSKTMFWIVLFPFSVFDSFASL